MAEKNEVTLRVQEAYHRDVGRGIARINERHIKEIGVSYGDIVQISGRRSTAAIVGSRLSFGHAPGHRAHRRHREAQRRHDTGRLRGGREGEVERGEEGGAHARPEGHPHLRVAGEPAGLVPEQARVPGDIVSTSTYTPPSQSLNSNLMFEEFFRDFFSSPSFGLGEVKLAIASTVPAGVVKITEVTEIQLLPEATEVVKDEVPEVTYEDLGG